MTDNSIMHRFIQSSTFSIEQGDPDVLYISGFTRPVSIQSLYRVMSCPQSGRCHTKDVWTLDSNDLVFTGRNLLWNHKYTREYLLRKFVLKTS